MVCYEEKKIINLKVPFSDLKYVAIADHFFFIKQCLFYLYAGCIINVFDVI